VDFIAAGCAAGPGQLLGPFGLHLLPAAMRVWLIDVLFESHDTPTLTLVGAPFAANPLLVLEFALFRELFTPLAALWRLLVQGLGDTRRSAPGREFDYRHRELVFPTLDS
jgi:hypothetical protein